MHARATEHADVALVRDGGAGHVLVREQRGDGRAATHVTALAHAAVLVVLAAGGLEFGEVHVTGEYSLLLCRQRRVVGARLFAIADEAEAFGQPGEQFVFIGSGDLAALERQRFARLHHLGRVEIALDEAPVVRAVGTRARLHHDTGARALVPGGHGTEAGNADLVVHANVAARRQFQGAGSCDIEAAVEDVATRADDRDIGGIVVHEQVAGNVVRRVSAAAAGAAQQRAAADDVAPGQHPDRACAFMECLSETRVIHAVEGDRASTVDPHQITTQRIETRGLQRIAPRQARGIGSEGEQWRAPQARRAAIAGNIAAARNQGTAGKSLEGRIQNARQRLWRRTGTADGQITAVDRAPGQQFQLTGGRRRQHQGAMRGQGAGVYARSAAVVQVAAGRDRAQCRGIDHRHVGCRSLIVQRREVAPQ